MRTNFMIAFSLVAAFGIMLTACGSEPEPVATKGQELQDLQNAYKNRAITPDEYKDQKEEVLDR